MIRVISGDHERTALDFQKHYRLDMVHLMDTDLSLQIKHSRGGWPFLMLVDSDGNVVHKANNLVDRETKILKSLQAMKCTVQAAPLKTIDGTSYSTETLYRSGDLASRRARERFSCLAAAPDGRLFLVFTSSRDDDSNVWLRIWDGDRWSEDRPVAASAADEYDGTVIVGPDDQAWFCWTSNAGSDKYDVFVTNLSRLDESKDPIRVTRSDDDAMCGRLACDASGVLWITYYKWQKNRAGISRDKEIFVRQFRDGVLSQEVQVSPTDVPSYEDHTDPTIALVGDQALIGWSWDFHRPKGYTQEAREPTIFLRPVESNLMLGQTFHASGHNIDMVPVLAARGDTAWCVWDSLGRTGGSYGKSLFVRRVQAQICAGEPVQIVSNLEHLCSPCFALGSNERNVLVWCQKERDKQWQLMRSDCDPQGHWSGARILVDRVNPRYCSAAFDARDNLWISYTADTEQGRQVKVQRLP